MYVACAVRKVYGTARYGTAWNGMRLGAVRHDICSAPRKPSIARRIRDFMHGCRWLCAVLGVFGSPVKHSTQLIVFGAADAMVAAGPSAVTRQLLALAATYVANTARSPFPTYNPSPPLPLPTTIFGWLTAWHSAASCSARRLRSLVAENTTVLTATGRPCHVPGEGGASST